MKARTGKIARLPKAVRDQLNQRLADGESGEALLDWLHGQPDVLEVLARHFEGRPILKQNLSEWRLGGFRDWEARQERLEQVRQLGEEAEEVQAAVSELPEQLSAILASRFANLMATTAKVKDWSKPRQRAQLMEMCEGIATLRRCDQGAARLKLEREMLSMKQAELQLAQEAQIKRTHAEWRAWADDYMKAVLASSKTPEDALRGVLTLLYGHADEELIREEREKNRSKAGLPIMPDDATLLERTESLLRTHALTTKMKPGAEWEDQTLSNPVKP